MSPTFRVPSGWSFRSEDIYDLFASYSETIAHCDSAWQWPGLARSHRCALAPDHADQFCRCDCGEEMLVLGRLRVEMHQPSGNPMREHDVLDATLYALKMYRERS